MKVVLSVDMEGISQITDARELLACCREYWATGREKLTEDVAAAASGLLDAGATEVLLLDNHASGNAANVLVERLPDGVRSATLNVFDLPAQRIDAMLQLGYHPRAGVSGFVPHSYIPGLQLRVDGEEISESHGRIWAAQTALIGIVGHAAHGRTLGSLAGTPFLSVQDGGDPHRAEPLFGTAQASAEAIRDFARQALREATAAPRPRPPREVMFEAKLETCDDAAAGMMEEAGWRRKSQREFAVELSDWSDARRPLECAMTAAFRPFARDLALLDLRSAAALSKQDPDRLEGLTSKFLASVDHR